MIIFGICEPQVDSFDAVFFGSDFTSGPGVRYDIGKIGSNERMFNHHELEQALELFADNFPLLLIKVFPELRPLVLFHHAVVLIFRWLLIRLHVVNHDEKKHTQRPKIRGDGVVFYLLVEDHGIHAVIGANKG